MSSARLSFSSLCRTVIDLCRLRGNPQDFPYSPNLLALLVCADAALGALAGFMLGDAANALARSLLSTGIVLALSWIALAIRGLGNRYVQTAGALFACSVALSLLQLPIGLIYEPLDQIGAIAPLSYVLLQFLISWAAFGLFVWQVVINAHIIRRAMDASFGFALVLVITWLITYFALDRIMFGAA